MVALNLRSTYKILCNLGWRHSSMLASRPPQSTPVLEVALQPYNESERSVPREVSSAANAASMESSPSVVANYKSDRLLTTVHRRVVKHGVLFTLAYTLLSYAIAFSSHYSHGVESSYGLPFAGKATEMIVLFALLLVYIPMGYLWRLAVRISKGSMDLYGASSVASASSKLLMLANSTKILLAALLICLFLGKVILSSVFAARFIRLHGSKPSIQRFRSVLSGRAKTALGCFQNQLIELSIALMWTLSVPVKIVRRIPRWLHLITITPFCILMRVYSVSLTSLPAFLQNEDERHLQTAKRYNTRIGFYSKLPLKLLSRAWGSLNDLTVPVWLRTPVFSLYIWMFDCQLQEAEVQDLKQYRNLSEFFRRRLRAGVRPIDTQHILTSPADGRILHVGRVENNALEQVKGVTYSMRGFLGPPEGLVSQNAQQVASKSDVLSNPQDKDAEYCNKLITHPGNELFQCIIYLAPGDYHRFHSPADWSVKSRRHIPGELFSVKPRVARWLQGLFSMNERAVYAGSWRHGFFSYTPVGATNVGSINVFHDPELKTNTGMPYSLGEHHDLLFDDVEQEKGLQVGQGELVGEFNLGSTIVLLFEAPKSFGFSVKPGQKVKVGEGMGTCS